MDNNIGERIKKFAKIVGWLYLVAGFIVGIALWTENDEFFHFFISVISGLALYPSSWLLYGFGQLVEDVHMLRKKTCEKQQRKAYDWLPEL